MGSSKTSSPLPRKMHDLDTVQPEKSKVVSRTSRLRPRAEPQDDAEAGRPLRASKEASGLRVPQVEGGERVVRGRGQGRAQGQPSLPSEAGPEAAPRRVRKLGVRPGRPGAAGKPRGKVEGGRGGSPGPRLLPPTWVGGPTGKKNATPAKASAAGPSRTEAPTGRGWRPGGGFREGSGDGVQPHLPPTPPRRLHCV